MHPDASGFLISLALFVPAIAFFVAARWCAARLLVVGPSRLFPREGSLFRRALVATAGPLACLFAVMAMATAGFLIAGVRGPGHARLNTVAPGSPADRAGLRAGDVLLAVDGHEIVAAPGPTVRVDGDPTFSIFASETASVVAGTSGREFPVVIERAGARMTSTLRAEDGRIGIGITEDEPFVHSPGRAVVEGLKFPFVALTDATEAMSSDPRPRALVKIAVMGAVGTSSGVSGWHTALPHLAWPILVVGLAGVPISLLLLLALRSRRA